MSAGEVLVVLIQEWSGIGPIVKLETGLEFEEAVSKKMLTFGALTPMLGITGTGCPSSLRSGDIFRHLL
jgi:hypothetical protein